MQLVVKNVARISSAKIDLNGIAVVAGANGTGKSTISRSLMTISSISRRINSLILVERVRSIISSLKRAFKELGGDLYYSEDAFGKDVESWATWLSIDWWKNDEVVVSWLKEHHRQEIFVVPPRFLDSDKCIEGIKTAKQKIFDVLDRSDETYVTHICRRLFKQAFNGQIKPVFSNQIDSLISVEDIANENLRVSVELKDGDVNSYTEIGRVFYPSVVYFEPLNYVDFVNNMDEPISDRYSAGGHCSCFVIKKEPPKNLSFEEQAELDEAKEILKDIVTNIHGRLVDDNADIKFNESFSDGEHLIDVKNIASGMKTLAAIVRAVENRSIRRGSLLIIDEPESNLHPQWQVAFAAFLAAFSKRLGVSLLLNTHSPYFLQAILTCSRRNGGSCRFYDMEKDVGADSYHTIDVTENIDRVFKVMATPLDNLFVS